MRILPDTAEPEFEGFWASARRYRFAVPCCRGCGHCWFPPGPVCPRCHSAEIDWRETSGTGSVWSFVVAHAPVLPAFADRVPYPVAVIELQVGDTSVRVVGDLVDGQGAPLASAAIAIGMPVRVVFEDLPDEVTLPHWMPLEED